MDTLAFDTLSYLSSVLLTTTLSISFHYHLNYPVFSPSWLIQETTHVFPYQPKLHTSSYSLLIPIMISSYRPFLQLSITCSLSLSSMQTLTVINIFFHCCPSPNSTFTTYLHYSSSTIYHFSSMNV